MEKDITRTKQIMELIENDISICVYDIKTNSYFGKNMKREFYPASMFKVLIGLAVLRLVQSGAFSLEDILEIIPINWTNDIKIFPDDVGRRLVAGESKTIDELLHLMLHISDNTASHTLISMIGIEEIESTIRFLQLEQTGFTQKYYESLKSGERLSKSDMIYTTAFDLVRIFSYINDGVRDNEWVCVRLQKYMQQSHVKEKHFGLFLEKYNEFYGKGGFVEINLWQWKYLRALLKNLWEYGIGYTVFHNDCGVISVSGLQYVVCIGTKRSSFFPLRNHSLRTYAHVVYDLMCKQY